MADAGGHNRPEEVRAERRARFLAALPREMSVDEMLSAWEDHTQFMAEVYGGSFDRDTERQLVVDFIAGRSAKTPRSPKPAKGRKPTKPKRRKAAAPTAKLTKRNAKDSGRCITCGKNYFRGDEVAGANGEWFHARHLSKTQYRKLDRKSVFVREVPGGAMESNRRKH